MKRYCEVYFRGDAVFVISLAETRPYGFMIRYGPMFKLGREERPEAWGEAVLKAFASFAKDVPAPAATGAASPEFLDFVGVKSWNTFMRGTLHLGAEHDGREVTLTPSARNRGGFDYLPPEQAVKCPPEPQAAGQALLEALRRCS